MIEKYKKTYAEYMKSRKEFIDYLEKRIRKIGTVKLSLKLGKSPTYLTHAIKKRTSNYQFWIDLDEFLNHIEKEKSKIIK